VVLQNLSFTFEWKNNKLKLSEIKSQIRNDSIDNIKSFYGLEKEEV
jgi:hypothetical protein